MKRWLVIVVAVASLGLNGRAEDMVLTRVKVLKNNCNLRAKALVTSEVVAQVSENDVLLAKMMNKEWVEVVPPTNVDLWVLGDYVKSGVITCSQKVNVRAGAGINFNIVGQLPQGEKVEVRGTHAEWIKIAPVPACSLWISRSLVSEIPLTYVEPAKLEPAKTESVKPVPAPEVAIAPTPKPEPAVKPTVPTPLPKPVRPPASPAESGVASAPTAPVTPAPMPVAAPVPAQADPFAPPPGLDLIATTGQGRWREVEGIMQAKSFFARAPSDFRLISCDDNKNSETICFVKGNQAQLKALMYRRLVVSGREYWVKRQKYPVIVPERIVLK